MIGMIILITCWIIVGILNFISHKVKKEPADWSSFWLAYIIAIFFMLDYMGEQYLW